MHARGDLVNQIYSSGSTYKHADFTVSGEVFFGREGEDLKTGAPIVHPVYAGTPVWCRMGVHLPVSKETSIGWTGGVGNKFLSSLNINQKINKNINVSVTNEYKTGQDVKVGMTFNYSV